MVHQRLSEGPWKLPGKKWSTVVPIRALENEMTFAVNAEYIQVVISCASVSFWRLTASHSVGNVSSGKYTQPIPSGPSTLGWSSTNKAKLTKSICQNLRHLLLSSTCSPGMLGDNKFIWYSLPITWVMIIGLNELFLISYHVAPQLGPRNPPAKQRRNSWEKLF